MYVPRKKELFVYQTDKGKRYGRMLAPKRDIMLMHQVSLREGIDGRGRGTRASGIPDSILAAMEQAGAIDFSSRKIDVDILKTMPLDIEPGQIRQREEDAIGPREAILCRLADEGEVLRVDLRSLRNLINSSRNSAEFEEDKSILTKMFPVGDEIGDKKQIKLLLLLALRSSYAFRSIGEWLIDTGRLNIIDNIIEQASPANKALICMRVARGLYDAMERRALEELPFNGDLICNDREDVEEAIEEYKLKWTPKYKEAAIKYAMKMKECLIQHVKNKADKDRLQDEMYKFSKMLYDLGLTKEADQVKQHLKKISRKGRSEAL